MAKQTTAQQRKINEAVETAMLSLDSNYSYEVVFQYHVGTHLPGVGNLEIKHELGHYIGGSRDLPIVRVDPTNPAQMIHAARLYRALDESGAAPTIDTRLDSRSNIARYDPAVIELMKRDAEALIKMAAALESMNEGKKDGSR